MRDIDYLKANSSAIILGSNSQLSEDVCEVSWFVQTGVKMS